MKSNEELQKDVQNAIKWEPLLNAAEIGVIAKDGIVTLTGSVTSFAKKSEAEEAAKSVAGVKAVVEEIEIVFHNSFIKTDTEIAADVIETLKLNWIPDDKVKVHVEDGWVRLAGELQWNFQKEAAKTAISKLPGIKGVTNNISIKASLLYIIEKKDIEEALARNWSIDDHQINVDVAGNRVTLNGTVNSFYQKDEASRIAWNAPGVCLVDNNLDIEFSV